MYVSLNCSKIPGEKRVCVFQTAQNGRKSEGGAYCKVSREEGIVSLVAGQTPLTLMGAKTRTGSSVKYIGVYGSQLDHACE